MSRRFARLPLRLRRAAFHRRLSLFATSRHSRLGFEPLEDRRLLAVDLTLAGAQTLIGGNNVSASSDQATQQQNMAIDIDPTNPLHVAGVSERNTPTTGTSLGLYRSANGGSTWTTTTIDNSVDGFGVAAIRFDPSLAYDADGVLYVAYGVDDGTDTRLIVASSTDDGATFANVVTVDTLGNLLGSLDGFSLGTGPDGLGGQAAYVAYTSNSLVFESILVAGSNDGGATFTAPVPVTTGFLATLTNGDPAVGPDGQLYVSWFDVGAETVFVDADLDGLFAAGNMFGADVIVVDNATPRPTGPGNFDLFSGQLVPAQPTHGISSSPELDTDRSGHSTDGNLYITFVDLFSAADDNTDVYIARSTNQGANWTLIPVAVASATEFNPAVDVDPTSGSVNLMYYSTAGDTATGNDDVNVMLAASIDGGLTYVDDQQLTTATSRASAIVGGNDLGDYNGLAVHDGTIQGLSADNRGPSLQVEAFTASASYSSATDENLLAVTGTAGADNVLIRRSAANNAFIEVFVNGVLDYAGLFATLDQTSVDTGAISDALTIDNSNGVVPTLINYNGGISLFDNDTLVITGNPGFQVARETYRAGVPAGTGIWVLDPDDSQGPGASVAGNGDELTVNFINLEPAVTDVPAVVFDVILNTEANVGTIQDSGMINGANALELDDNGTTFESARFANKVTARIMGQSGADSLTADYTTASALLEALELYGHLASDVLGQPADDDAGDTLQVLRNAADVDHLLQGNGGDDIFTVGNGDLTQILSPVNVFGNDGNDALTVNDSVRLTDVDYLVNPTTIAICNDLGPPPDRTFIANFDGTLEQAGLQGTQGINQFDVTPSISTELFIDGNLPATPPGDFLSVRFEFTTGRTLTFTDQATGTGMWEFTNRMDVRFEDIERFNFFPVLVYSADASKNGKPTVKVVDSDMGTLVTSFLAYAASYKGGVRVAVGDVTGDGIPEILTAPGRNLAPQVKVFDILTGAEIATAAITVYANAFRGGVTLAVGDVDDDGLLDLVVAPSRGKSEIRVFLNQSVTNPGVPFDNANVNAFLALPKNFLGGVTVAAGDVSGDIRSEIIVGSGPGIRNEVRIFDGLTNGSVTTPAAFLQRFFPFPARFRGGVFVAVAQLNSALISPKLEIIVGNGTGGRSQVSTFSTANLAVPLNTFFGVYSGSGFNAPIRVAAIDADFDNVVDIFAAQGPDGKSQRIRTSLPAGPFVDFLMENAVEFRNGFFLATDVNGLPPFLC